MHNSATISETTGATHAVSDDELQARLTFWRVSGLGAAALRHILQHFGAAAPALAASDNELNQAGLKPGVIAKYRAAMQADLQQAVQRDLDWLNNAGNHYILTPENPRYPQTLTAFSSAPPLLFVLGDPDLLNDPQIAMVGSRHPTAGGKENATAFSSHLAGNGLCITSGLALGIDAHSHEGALDANGSTIAVVGTGLDIVYPARNRALAERIAAHGAIISEFPIGVKPQAQHFPRRNRIISGMSVGTLVVEAALRSGSLVTAKHAMEQGREVFAIPGSIHNPMARGCHQLIRQGAKLVETANDILEEIAPHLHSYLQDNTPSLEHATQQVAPQSTPQTTAQKTPQQSHKPADKLGDLPPLSTDDQRIIDALGHDPVPIDQIVLHTGLTAEAVSSMLLMLELQGYVAACGGGHYMRV